MLFFRFSSMEGNINVMGAQQQNITPLTHNPKLPTGAIASVMASEGEKTKNEILNLVGSFKQDLISSVTGIVGQIQEEGNARADEQTAAQAAQAAEQLAALDRLSTQHAETQAFIRDPRAMRTQMASDKSLLGRKNQQYFNEGAYATVTDARDFVRNSPAGAVLETTGWVVNSLLLSGLVAGYFFGGDPVEAALK